MNGNHSGRASSDEYDPGKYSGVRAVKDAPTDVEEMRCGSIAYTRSNAALLVELKGGKQVRQMQYVPLQNDGAEDGMSSDGTMFRVTFAGYHVQRLIVRGRNLKRLFDALALHRLCTPRAVERSQFEEGAGAGGFRYQDRAGRDRHLDLVLRRCDLLFGEQCCEVDRKEV